MAHTLRVVRPLRPHAALTSGSSSVVAEVFFSQCAGPEPPGWVLSERGLGHEGRRTLGARVTTLGYWIVSSRRRRGLARSGVVLLSRWALGLAPVDRIEALVDPSNGASISVLQGSGFEREAKLRSYFEADGGRSDALLFSLISTDTA